jgi:phosphate starvation-inducible PhoH-like protein
MNEINLNIDNNLVTFFGVNNAHFNYLTSAFPKLKLIARGSEIKVIGNENDIQIFETIFTRILEHINKYNSIDLEQIKLLVLNIEATNTNADKNLILYGNFGKAIISRTENQKKIVSESFKNDMIFAIGPAGTGKTYTAIAIAVKALKEKSVKRIILTRPAVEAGEQLGYLPGDMKEKLDPYLQPLYDALYDMIPGKKLQELFADKIIEIAPLAYMRGRTLDNAFVILDEAQNTSFSQLKMFLTRMGKNAKFIITGDLTQIDLPKKTQSGLANIIDKLNNINEISIIKLDETDIVRHNIVKKIIKALEKND